jgi:hypothetical protein
VNTHDPIGDLRAALDAHRADPDQIRWVASALFAALDSSDAPDARDAYLGMATRALAHTPAGRATAAERLDFIARGLPALTRRVAADYPWVRLPSLAARTWAAAFAWQSIVNMPEAPAREGMHTCMGVGRGHIIALQWDTQSRWGNHVRHVTAAEGTLTAGQFNTFAGLSGLPDLPEHLVAFDARHVDPEP